MNQKANKTCIKECRSGYRTPVSRLVDLTPEGVLCTSLTGTSVENYDYEEFNW